jgi:hypothetical protein
MSQIRRAQRMQNEVPFGIRAIEEGIEVEGVWISQPNTPEPLSRESSMTSLTDILNPKHIATNEQASQHQNVAAANELGTEVHTKHRLEATSSEAHSQPDSNSSLSQAADIITSKFVPRIRNSFLKSSRYSSVATSPRGSSEVNVSRGSDASSSSSLYQHARRTSEIADERFRSDSIFHNYKLSTTSSEAAYMSPETPDAGQQCVMTQHTQANHDFELMQSHRRSQAAEMGQLTPRSRRPISNDCSERFHDSARSSYEIQPFLGVASSYAHYSASLEPESFSARPHTVDKQPLAMDSPQVLYSNGRPVQEKMIAELRIVTSLENQTPTAPQKDEASLTALPQRSSFEVRDSPVIRGRGSGFEILKPGTFKCSLPPISLHNTAQSRSWDRGRKLQKRPRSSDSTSKLSFEERRRSWAGSLPTP